MTVSVRLLTRAEQRDSETRRIERHATWRAAHPDWNSEDGWTAEQYQINAEAWRPGYMWEAPWYHDPADPDDAELGARMRARSDAEWDAMPNSFLSRHYWRDWSLIRPPLVIILPNGDWWCPDQVSSNGTGWVVTGELPAITCSPSIAAPGYHGFLQGGRFTPDCERPHAPNGLLRDGTPA